MLNKHGGVEADLTVSAIEPGSGASVHHPAFHSNLHLYHSITTLHTLLLGYRFLPDRLIFTMDRITVGYRQIQRTLYL